MVEGPVRDYKARLHRDQQATAWHEQAVASGQKRYLRRAFNGELVSYLPEEYGVARNANGPRIRTVWDTQFWLPAR